MYTGLETLKIAEPHIEQKYRIIYETFSDFLMGAAPGIAVAGVSYCMDNHSTAMAGEIAGAAIGVAGGILRVARKSF